jgi:endonuclease
MHQFAQERLRAGQVFGKDDAIAWFREKYPKIKSNTVGMHVEGMAVNSQVRKHHANVKPGKDFDLFYKVGPGRFRLWDPATDPKPIYRDDILRAETGNDDVIMTAQELAEAENGEELIDKEAPAGTQEFAYEKDLRNYLGLNLHLIENGLHLYEDEDREFNGIEFPVGGRLIDILAVDMDGGFVVVELKVSRGYDRVIGQLLRYMAWIANNLANGKRVRGVIVASEISDDLKLATSLVKDVALWQYKISFQLNRVA